MRSGQALVIVLMILAVVSAVGLSVVSRSVSEVSLSSTQDDSSQALTAAEAGIESILANPNAPTQTPNSVGGGSYTILARSAAPTSPEASLADSLRSGEAATLFLKGVNTTTGAFDGANYGGTSITVCWGQVGSTGPAGQEPSMEATVYYLTSSSTYTSVLTGYNSVTRSNGLINVASAANATCNNNPPNNFAFQGVVSTNLGGAGSVPLFAHIRLLYNETNGHPVKVVASTGQFVSQGTVSDVLGEAGDADRRIQVIEKYPEPLTILDNALYSGSGL